MRRCFSIYCEEKVTVKEVQECKILRTEKKKEFYNRVRGKFTPRIKVTIFRRFRCNSCERLPPRPSPDALQENPVLGNRTVCNISDDTKKKKKSKETQRGGRNRKMDLGIHTKLTRIDRPTVILDYAIAQPCYLAILFQLQREPRCEVPARLVPAAPALPGQYLLIT